MASSHPLPPSLTSTPQQLCHDDDDDFGHNVSPNDGNFSFRQQKLDSSVCFFFFEFNYSLLES